VFDPKDSLKSLTNDYLNLKKRNYKVGCVIGVFFLVRALSFVHNLALFIAYDSGFSDGVTLGSSGISLTVTHWHNKARRAIVSAMGVV